MQFNSTDYPSERFSYDGKSGKVAFIKSGRWSMPGSFVTSNKTLLGESLRGGALASSWALVDAPGKKPKLSFDGTKKVDGKETYVLGYTPKGGGADVNIKLYFEKDTFRHVRSEYKRMTSAPIGNAPEQSSRFNETRLTLTEEFSDFKSENGLTLPHRYSIRYSISGQRRTTEIEWVSVLNQFVFNQTLASTTFDADTN